MTTEPIKANQLHPGDVIQLGKKQATITGFSERHSGRSLIQGGRIVHLAGAHDVSSLCGDETWYRVVV